MTQAYLPLAKVFQLLASKTKVSDFFLKFCSSSHSFLALSYSFLRNSWLALRALATSDLALMTSSRLERTNLTIFSTVTSSSNLTGDSRLSPTKVTELSESPPLTKATWIIPLKTSETSSKTEAEDSKSKS